MQNCFIPFLWCAVMLGAGQPPILAQDAPAPPPANGGEPAAANQNDASLNPSLILQWAREEGTYPEETEDEDAKDIAHKLKVSPPPGKKRGATFMLTRDTPDLLPPVVDQGHLPGAAWATAYYCYSYSVAQKYHLSPEQVKTLKFQFSPAFLYYAATQGQKKPLTVPAAFEALNKNGCASLLEAPCADESDLEPDALAKARASRYRPYNICSLGKGTIRDERIEPEDVKNWLFFSRQPIVLELQLWKDFPFRGATWNGGEIPKNYVYAPKVKLLKANRAGHQAVTIVGYDESKKAFRIVNSWGLQWGDNGGLWIDENFVVNYGFDAWSLQLPGGPFLKEPTDHAVVVGIDKYPNLNKGALRGCQNDAQAVAGTLREYGFAVDVLVNGDATKDNIKEALYKLRNVSNKNNRLVFYFAGHGAQNPAGGSILLPADAREDSSRYDLATSELNEALLDIPARTRTVLVDACFSGGMMKSVEPWFDQGDDKDVLPRFLTEKPKILGTRYYRRPALDGESSMVPVADQDTNALLNTGSRGEICYLVASRGNEQALEAKINGYAHGVFSYALLRYLSGDKMPWGDLSAKVSGEVQAQLGKDAQHPTLSPAFADVPIFEATAATRPLFTTDDFQTDHIDTTKIKLSLEPNRTSLKIGEVATFKVLRGVPGQLVIVDRDQNDIIKLLIPPKGQADEFYGKTEPIFADIRAKGPVGTERLKAFLFTDRQQAEVLLQAFAVKEKLTSAELKQKLSQAPNAAAPQQNKAPNAGTFYTSDITFETIE